MHSDTRFLIGMFFFYLLLALVVGFGVVLFLVSLRCMDIPGGLIYFLPLPTCVQN